jgi:hypothetical protein
VHECQTPALDLLSKGSLGGLDCRRVRVDRHDPVPAAQVVGRVQAVVQAYVVDEVVVDPVGRAHRRRAVFHATDRRLRARFSWNIFGHLTPHKVV